MEYLGECDNFYGINPPPIPPGWNIEFYYDDEPRVAGIDLDFQGKKSVVSLDHKRFKDPKLPEGCKVFMIFHEIGHHIFGPYESLCDRYAFYNALRAGVSPYLCYIAIKAFMPDHYSWRVDEMFNNLMENRHLACDVS